MQVDLVAIVVEDYDPAIKFFVDALGFELVEDSPSLTNDGRPKRWVVFRPPGAQTGILLAPALTGSIKRPSSAIKWLAASDSFCEWTISRPRMNG
jgi:catechol 2,3-dioxygenase-like lactoylglutathione lyase family enzyme